MPHAAASKLGLHCLHIYAPKTGIQSKIGLNTEVTEEGQTHTDQNTIDLQWLEHCWLVYHCCFELVLVPSKKNS